MWHASRSGSIGVQPRSTNDFDFEEEIKPCLSESLFRWMGPGVLRTPFPSLRASRVPLMDRSSWYER